MQCEVYLPDYDNDKTDQSYMHKTYEMAIGEEEFIAIKHIETNWYYMGFPTRVEVWVRIQGEKMWEKYEVIIDTEPVFGHSKE